jgi:hypothetical protein
MYVLIPETALVREDTRGSLLEVSIFDEQKIGQDICSRAPALQQKCQVHEDDTSSGFVS